MDNPFLAPNSVGGNVVLDLDGVVFLGSGPIEGVGPALRRLASDGWTVVFATNNGTRTRSHIVDRIGSQTGFRPVPEHVITSAVAATTMIAPSDQPVFVVGEDGLRETLRDADIAMTDAADACRTVLVALDRGFDYRTLSDASSAVRDGARFIATNGDLTFPTPDGQVPGAGSIVAAVAAASGRDPEFAGKPHRPMIEAVRRVLSPGDVWVIGDRPETDLALAVAAGWRSVLVLSGVTRDPADVPDRWRPDLIVESLPGLFDQ